MHKLKLMWASMICISSVNIALATDACDLYKFSVHNKNPKKKIFVKYDSVKNQVTVRPKSTAEVSTLGTGSTIIEIFDNGHNVLFKGTIHKDTSMPCGVISSPRYGMGSSIITLAGLVTLSPIMGSASVESSYAGDCVHNKIGEFTIVID